MWCVHDLTSYVFVLSTTPTTISGSILHHLQLDRVQENIKRNVCVRLTCGLNGKLYISGDYTKNETVLVVVLYLYIQIIVCTRK